MRMSVYDVFANAGIIGLSVELLGTTVVDYTAKGASYRDRQMSRAAMFAARYAKAANGPV